MRKLLLVLFTGILFVNAFGQSVTLTPDMPIDETNIDSRYLTIDIDGDTLVDSTLSAANFTLLNFPSGITVDSVLYVDTNTAEVYIAFDGTDFDSDSVNCYMTIAAAELTNGVALSTDSITITAIVETITITPNQSLTETNLDSSYLNLVISGDYFADNTVSIGNISLNNSPTGLSIDSIHYTDSLNAILYLGFDGTDFDTDYTNFNISIAGSELNSGLALNSNNITITAVVESATLTITPNQSLSETNLDNSYIDIALTNDYFTDNSLLLSNFSLNNVPNGLTIDSITYTDSVNAVLYLGFDGSDFDSDYNNFSITIAAAELNSAADLTSNNINITAVIESQNYLSIIPLTTLIEDSLDGAHVAMVLSNKTFSDTTLLASNFSINNAPAGITIDTVYYNDTIHATAELAFDGTDYDYDSLNVFLGIAGSEITTGDSLNSNTVAIEAINEEAIQEIQDLEAEVVVSMQDSISTLIGNEVSIDINIDYPDSISATIPTTYLTDIYITLDTLALNAGDTMYIDFNGTQVGTYSATGGEKEFWLMEKIGYSRPVLVNDTDATWTLRFNGLLESKRNVFATLKTGESGDFHTSSIYELGEDTTIMVIYEDITVTQNPSDTTICSGYALSLYAGGSSNTNINYQWRHSGVNITGETDSVLTISSIEQTSGGYYDCIISNMYYRDTTTSALVSVLTSPNIGILDLYEITEDDNILLGVSSGYDSYLWSTGDTTNMIFIDGEVLGIDTLTYTIVVTDASNGCETHDTTTIIITEGVFVEDIEGSIFSAVYPNPNSGKFAIKLSEKINNANLQIIDISGKVIENHIINQEYKEIDISEQKNGMYFIKLTDNKKVYLHKIIIE